MSTEIIEQFGQFKAGFETKHAELAGRLEKIQRAQDAIEAKFSNPNRGVPLGTQTKSLADVLFDSDEFKSFRKTGRGRYALEIETKALTSESLGLTSGIVPQGIAAPPAPRLRIRNLLNATQTSLSAVPFARESAHTDAAYPQIEASDKGESELTVEDALAVVSTIATWTRCPKQVLDDLALLRSYVNGRLLTFLANREDYELLRGTGIAGGLSGLMNYATPFAGSGSTLLDKLGNAFTQLESANFTPTGVVLNPSDWRAISLVREGEGTGAYMFGSPATAVQKTIWGVPAALTTAMPQNKFLVFDRAASEMFERQSATIELSDSHGDFFAKNMIAIRAEERLALAVYQPSGLVKGSL